MKVGQLKQLLIEVDDDTLVIISADGEGNRYSPLYDTSRSLYVPDTKVTGELYREGPITEIARNAGWAEEDYREVGEEGAVRCLVLWPSI